MAALAKVLQEALTLSVDDQAKLAAKLLANVEVCLDGPLEDQGVVDAAWTAELDRRADRARRGESRGIPAAEVHERVLASLRACR